MVAKRNSAGTNILMLELYCLALFPIKMNCQRQIPSQLISCGQIFFFFFFLFEPKKTFWWHFIKLFSRRQTVTDHFFKVSYVINENQHANAKACWGSQLFASVQDVPCQFTVNWKLYKGSKPFYIPCAHTLMDAKRFQCTHEVNDTISVEL